MVEFHASADDHENEVVNCNMTIAQIKEMVDGEQYDFLRTNQHLKDKIVFLTLGGSYAYGTNVETSDVDVRGCAMNSRSDLLGLSEFEQVVNTETDTTVYSFNKLVTLLMSCNPNTIEMLGCKPEHYLLMTDVGKELIENRHVFLSQRAAASFGGYATQQLRRLENAIAHDALPQSRQEEYLKNSMENSMADFERKYSAFPEGGIRLYTDVSSKPELDREVFADITLRHFPARGFHSMINDMTNVIGCYTKLNGRNRKKDAAHLNKHAMHLIRLYLMCIDILEREEVRTYRADEREMLLDIRNGKYQRDNGTYREEFFDMVNHYEDRLRYAKSNTNLPRTPNYKLVEELVIDVNRRAIAW